MKKVLVVIGTRPEAIKLAPVIQQLKLSTKLSPVVCLTGQHNIKDISKILTLFNIKSDHNLDVSVKEKVNLHFISCNILIQITTLLQKEKIHAVMVQGDTTTAAKSAEAAYLLKIPVIHVEAGLRTHDMDNPFPEEFNRRMIALMASFNFASSSIGYKNLKEEKIKNIHYVGNTIVDALFYIRKNFPTQEKNTNRVLVTCHRRENWNYVNNLCNVINRLSDVHKDLNFVICAHPNPDLQKKLKDNIHTKTEILYNVNYDKFVQLLSGSKFIITDSGGVQEEASVLGIPALVTRKCTERIEGVTSGVIKLVDLSDTENVIKEFEKRISGVQDMDKQYCVNDYNHGMASGIIKAILENEL
jgi:UDP-N-acetylglucosamine 2-epimerase (non-hydrolysing)